MRDEDCGIRADTVLARPFRLNVGGQYDHINIVAPLKGMDSNTVYTYGDTLYRSRTSGVVETMMSILNFVPTQSNGGQFTITCALCFLHFKLWDALQCLAQSS